MSFFRIIEYVKPFGYHYGKRFIPVPEMIPELVVPDLTDFKVRIV